MPTSFTAKSVIIDIADNWGNAYIGIRSIEFYYEEAIVSFTSSDYTAYATSTYSASFLPSNAFDQSLSKIGSQLYTQWLSANGTNTNQRLIAVFDSQIEFDSIVINNGHHIGSTTTMGAKNIKIHVSSDSITDTTYNAAISNSELIFDDQINEHISSDAVDDQELTLVSEGNSVETTPVSIVAGTPIVGTVMLDAIGIDGIITGSPVIGTITLGQIHVFNTPGIVTGTPVIEGFEFFSDIYIPLQDIAAEAPIIGMLDITVIVSPENIISGETIIGSITISNKLTIPHIITDTPIVEDINMGFVVSMDMVIGQTMFLANTDETIVFDVPETFMESTSETENIAWIAAIIGKTTASLEAQADIVAEIAFEALKLSMVAYTDAEVTANCPQTEMVAIAENNAIVQVSLMLPKTAMSVEAIPGAEVKIAINIPVTRLSMVCDNQAVIGIAVVLPHSTCHMIAYTESVNSMLFTSPKTGLVFDAYSNVLGSIEFYTPKPSWQSIVQSHSDEILRHVRGAVR